MKISNSKKQLAKIIHENGGWRDGAEFAAQDKNNAGRLRKVVFYCGDKPWFEAGKGYWGGNNTHDEFIIADRLIKNWHQTILSRAEYSHLYPVAEAAPDADGWIEWGGGTCPVDEGVLVDIRISSGKEMLGQRVRPRNWVKDGSFTDIIAYRLHKPEQARPEFCESVMRSIPEPSGKPTIEQLATDYRNAKDYADRKQQEADAAKADAEAKLAELVAAGKALGLVLSVEGAVGAEPEPELVITDWRDLRVGDIIWWGGDEDNAPGEYEVEQLEDADYDGYLTIAVGSYWVHYESDEWRFIRRPAKGDTNA